MSIEVDLFGANKCGSCDPRGSGRCGTCFGTGQNTHLNSPDPHCSQCAGTGVCQICKGTGKAQAASTYNKPWPMPIGLRLAISIFPAFMMFMVVVIGSPVHWGRGGPVMPRWLGVVLVSPFCMFVIKVIWTGVTLADMRSSTSICVTQRTWKVYSTKTSRMGRGTTRE